ncbi:MAG: methyltransferase domain-containing protein [Opitutaceae bacterium]|jgi:diaminopimelate decarboxylase
MPIEPTSSSFLAAGSGDWWSRSDCHYDDEGHLRFAGRGIAELAAAHGTPTYLYGGERIRANVLRLRAILDRLGLPTRLLYAMKSNRCAGVLRLMRALGVGLDLCSPGELLWAKACGFEETRLSFTAGSLSKADYAALAQVPALWINADSLTALRRIAEFSPGRELGIRINPAAGLGYGANEKVRYAGGKPTKFGIYRDRFPEALALARDLGLRVTGLHCHTGCGYLTPQLPAFAEVLRRIVEFLDQAPQITRINLGGGLGIPLCSADRELDLEAWAKLIRKAFHGRDNLTLEFEPGDYLVKDAGVLVTEVTQVEEKAGIVFVGVNAGFNVHPEPVFYRLPLEPVPALRRPGPGTRCTIAGNVNEALDVWAEDRVLSPLEPGDILCFLNAGGYGASMSSHHCLRNEMKEYFLSSGGSSDPACSNPESCSPLTLDEANKRAWDRLYASVPDLVWGSLPLPFLEQFRQEFERPITRPWRVLDAGSGEGRNLPFLLSCGPEETHALDSSINALAKMTPALIPRVRIQCADLSKTGYPDDFFDGITLLDVVETLPDNGPILRELLRILKPGGLLLCNIPGFDDGVTGKDMHAIGPSSFLYQDRYYFEFRSPEDAHALLCEAGFEVVRSIRSEWDETAHPGFRTDTHRHVSLVFLVRKPFHS